jgi:hypothetical protein
MGRLPGAVGALPDAPGPAPAPAVAPCAARAVQVLGRLSHRARNCRPRLSKTEARRRSVPTAPSDVKRAVNVAW